MRRFELHFSDHQVGVPWGADAEIKQFIWDYINNTSDCLNAIIWDTSSDITRGVKDSIRLFKRKKKK